MFYHIQNKHYLIVYKFNPKMDAQRVCSEHKCNIAKSGIYGGKLKNEIHTRYFHTTQPEFLPFNVGWCTMTLSQQGLNSSILSASSENSSGTSCQRTSCNCPSEKNDGMKCSKTTSSYVKAKPSSGFRNQDSSLSEQRRKYVIIKRQSLPRVEIRVDV